MRQFLSYSDAFVQCVITVPAVPKVAVTAGSDLKGSVGSFDRHPFTVAPSLVNPTLLNCAVMSANKSKTKHMAVSNDSKAGTNNYVNVMGQKEMKELKRVFIALCFFSEKNHIIERLLPLRKRTSGFEGSDAVDVKTRSQDEFQSLKHEEIKLEKELQAIRNRPNQHIRAQDAAAALKALGRNVTKREILEMLWEVDEKLDNVIDWEEFCLMFERNIRDNTGLEPAGFYHMVQFMIYDRDENGLVSLDETMHMLYARIGREKMESTITKLFGGDDGAPIIEHGHQGGEINFTRYCEVVDREQKKMFSESELGRMLAEKKNRKIDHKK